jgi:hypothetical protein
MLAFYRPVLRVGHKEPEIARIISDMRKLSVFGFRLNLFLIPGI